MQRGGGGAHKAMAALEAATQVTDALLDRRVEPGHDQGGAYFSRFQMCVLQMRPPRMQPSSFASSGPVEMM